MRRSVGSILPLITALAGCGSGQAIADGGTCPASPLALHVPAGGCGSVVVPSLGGASCSIDLDSVSGTRVELGQDAARDWTLTVSGDFPLCYGIAVPTSDAPCGYCYEISCGGGTPGTGWVTEPLSPTTRAWLIVEDVGRPFTVEVCAN